MTKNNNYDKLFKLRSSYFIWLDINFINCQTKGNQKIPKAKTFDATRYEQFDDEYPPGSGALEYDPKMRATYDAILDGEE